MNLTRRLDQSMGLFIPIRTLYCNVTQHFVTKFDEPCATISHNHRFGKVSYCCYRQILVTDGLDLLTLLLLILMKQIISHL